eukprot:3801751-Prymnesium_polylepis.1
MLVFHVEEVPTIAGVVVGRRSRSGGAGGHGGSGGGGGGGGRRRWWWWRQRPWRWEEEVVVAAVVAAAVAWCAGAGASFWLCACRAQPAVLAPMYRPRSRRMRPYSLTRTPLPSDAHSLCAAGGWQEKQKVDD